jgi:hypothetical protein
MREGCDHRDRARASRDTTPPLAPIEVRRTHCHRGRRGAGGASGAAGTRLVRSEASEGRTSRSGRAVNWIGRCGSRCGSRWPAAATGTVATRDRGRATQRGTIRRTPTVLREAAVGLSITSWIGSAPVRSDNGAAAAGCQTGARRRTRPGGRRGLQNRRGRGPRSGGFDSRPPPLAKAGVVDVAGAPFIP